MAKAKKTNKKNKALADKIIGLPLLVLIVLSILGFMAYMQYQQYNEKRNFVELENTLTSFSNKVEEELGKPSEKETKAYCNRTGEKSGPGKLYCGSRSGMNYPVDSASDAQVLSSKVKALLSQDVRFSNIEQQQPIELDDRWTEYVNFIISNTLGCSLKLSYRSSLLLESASSPGEPKPGHFSFLIRCTDFALKEYYPIGY